MPGVFELLFIIPFLIIAIVIGAVLLRATISLFNWLAGAKQIQPEAANQSVRPEGAQNVDVVPNNDGNPYSAPVVSVPDVRGVETGRGVPMPGFNKTMGIVVLFMVIGTVVNIAVSFGSIFVLSTFDMTSNAVSTMLFSSGLMLASWLSQFLVMAGLLKLMLPTTIGKACLVSLVFALIGIGIALLIGVTLGIVMSLMA